MFAYGDVPYLLKIYDGKEHIEDKVKCLYALFPQQPMTELTGASIREHEAVEKWDVVLKSLTTLGIERWEITSIKHVYIEKQPTTTVT